MARTKIVLFKSNIRRDGSCPVCLRVAKEDKTKYIDLQLSATKGQWDEVQDWPCMDAGRQRGG